MGIPRFAGHLQHYSVSTTLGQKRVHDDDSDTVRVDPPRFVIDGPGLAYHLYYRLAHRSTSLGAFDTLPSYDQIGQAAIVFLSEIEAHHVQISHIYFDGHLPLHKRHVRLSRLESNLKDLTKVRTQYANGLGVSDLSSKPSPWTASQLFNSFHSVPHLLRGLPPPPFLVPAVLDALGTTRYASITEVVPGEADASCAKAAKDQGGMILTSDSDLLVYNIGDNNAVLFFSGLEIHEEASATHVISVLKANIYPTAQIAKRLELPGLQQLAYHCKLDPTVSFAEARRRAHQPMLDESSWRCFQDEYSTPDFDESCQDTSLLVRLRGSLDPRLSEFILQLSPLAREVDTNIYLPFLIEDPSRASAWYISSLIRQTIYLVIAARISSLPASLPLRAVTEFSRRGLRIVPSTVPLSTSTAPTAQRLDNSNIRNISSRLQKTKERFRVVSPTFRYRIYALKEIYCWYVVNIKNPPSKSSITRTTTGSVGSLVQWEDIHLEAQIQAVLYALRMVKQGLSYIADGKAGVEGIVELKDILEDLPPLSGLLPTFAELRGFAEKEKIEVSQVVLYVMQIEDAENQFEDGGNVGTTEKSAQ